jgi:hypothetical protein
MFQFLNGRRTPVTSTQSHTIEKVELPWGRERSPDRELSMQGGQGYAMPENGVNALSRPSVCCVARACAAFQDAHAAFSTAADGGVESCPELESRRDKTFEQVRLFPAQTRQALQAKKRVLDVMADWFSIDDARVAAFSFEVLTEALALLEGDAAYRCSCHHTDGVAQLPEVRSPERRNPLSWFIRPRGDTTDAPFAN